MISVDDYLFYVDRALDGMVEIVTGLGDELANRRPDLPGANSPYQILTHCLGVLEYWGGHVVAGRQIERDREAEFRAAGTVADLVARVRAARRRFTADLVDLQPNESPRGATSEDLGPLTRTRGGALVHVYEELAQHHGQMELTRDVLTAASA